MSTRSAPITPALELLALLAGDTGLPIVFPDLENHSRQRLVIHPNGTYHLQGPRSARVVTAARVANWIRRNHSPAQEEAPDA